MEDKIKHYKLGNTIQEFEELFGNTPINDIEKIKKYIFQNYIPKSKIKEKIEELNMEYGKLFLIGNPISFDMCRAKIEVLQELMEDK